MLSHQVQVIRSYRTLLKTIRHVFKNDPRMLFAGSVEARKVGIWSASEDFWLQLWMNFTISLSLRSFLS